MKYLVIASIIGGIIGGAVYWYNEQLKEVKQAGYDLAVGDYAEKFTEAEAKVEKAEADLRARNSELIKQKVEHESKQRKQARETQKWRVLFNDSKDATTRCHSTTGIVWLINQALGYSFEEQGVPADKSEFISQGGSLSALTCGRR